MSILNDDLKAENLEKMFESFEENYRLIGHILEALAK